jgi:hypothetical protein
MGANVPPPPQEKGTLEKLDDKINSVIQKSPVSVQTPTGLQQSILERMETNAGRQKVMFGAADRIENLLPRN